MKNDWEHYLGYVVRPYTGGPDYRIEVATPELLPLQKGAVKANDTASHEFNMDVGTGLPITQQVLIRSTVECEYYGNHTNLTPPHVATGELINLRHHLPSQRFFWEPLGAAGFDHRINERVELFAVSRTTPGARPNESELYRVVLDSRPGHRTVEIVTTKAAGESVAYAVQILPDEGKLTIRDDQAQTVELDAKGTVAITAKTAINLTAPLINLNNQVKLANGKLNVDVMSVYKGHAAFKAGTSGDRT